MDGSLDINLIVKVQQFEDKRIQAKTSWNIKELKGKLSEIYPTSTEEQKLIYSGKLLNDTVVLKDVLREYEGQESTTHTVHLVFTPKTSSRLQSKLQENQSNCESTSQSSTATSSNMSTELRQRHTTTTSSTATTANANVIQEQQQQTQSNVNIPISNNPYFNAFYGNSMPLDANSILAQQYVMQSWMNQAYAQYMNQYMNIMSSSVDQQTQQTTNLAFMQPQMPFITPPTSTASPPPAPLLQTQSSNTEASAAAAAPQVEQPPQPAAEPQRRFPNIIQDEQENRDWLDILYSCSRLLILLCLVYFYSSPLRCIVVVLFAVAVYFYHSYRQNQNRLNNNNTTRVNLNNVNNRPVAAPAVVAQENQENAEQNEEQQQPQSNSESEPLVEATNETTQQNDDPQVSALTVMRTFVISFVASIIPENPAM